MMNCVAKFITSSDEIWIYQVILSEKYTVNLYDIITFKFNSITFRQQMKNQLLYPIFSCIQMLWKTRIRIVLLHCPFK